MIGALLAGGQALLGAYQANQARNQASEYEARMESMAKQSPLMKESPEIANYYGEALNRYKQNAFTSPYYLETMKQAERQGANQISQAQTRGAALGLIPKINQGIMDAKGRGIVGALANKNAEFGQLGSATQMRKGERDQMFDINQMTPFNRSLQLQQLKTQAANDRYNAGLSMIGQGASNLAQYQIAKEMYNPKLKTDVDVAQTGLPVSYKTKGLSSYFGSPFDYKSFQSQPVSANPEAFGSYTGDFSKNPLMTSNYWKPMNNKGFKSAFGITY